MVWIALENIILTGQCHYATQQKLCTRLFRQVHNVGNGENFLPPAPTASSENKRRQIYVSTTGQSRPVICICGL